MGWGGVGWGGVGWDGVRRGGAGRRGPARGGVKCMQAGQLRQRTQLGARGNPRQAAAVLGTAIPPLAQGFGRADQ
jgi:hypothetical protein